MFCCYCYLVTKPCLTLWHHGLSLPKLPCPSLCPRVCSTHVHWVDDAIEQFPPLSPPFSPALNLSQHQVFSNESALHIRWPKYWSFSFSIRPFNEYSGSILFKINLFDLRGVQGILKSLIQHHSWKVSILWCSAFFMVQHSHPYTTTGKSIRLGIWTFVGKMISVLFFFCF